MSETLVRDAVNLSAPPRSSEPEVGIVAPMRVLERAVYRGPHLFSHTPMIRIQLDLGALETRPTNLLADFTDGLLEILPSLGQHGCSYHAPGGLVRRMREGTWIGHVTEHVALELQSLAGSAVTRGKTRSVKGRPGVYNVMYAYWEEEVGLLAGRLALELVRSLLPPELQDLEGLHRIYVDEEEPALLGAFDIGLAIAALRRIEKRRALGPTTRSLVREAERRGIPTMRLDKDSLVQLGYGRHQHRIRASITGRTCHVAVEAASDKDLTKALLDSAGLPVPRGHVVGSGDEAVRAAERLGYPVVTKPLDGNHGRGVSIDLSSPDQVRWGFEQAREHGRRVIVEQHYVGHDHRILVVGGEVVAVAERVPARVVGDGRSTISQLIEEVNKDPRRGEGHEQFMTRIKVDEHVHDLLARSRLTTDSVPEPGRAVYLRATANLSTGGTAIDRTDDIHPENASIARRAALAVGLDVAGIDFIVPDITRSAHQTGGGIVEVNAAPGFRMHLLPSEGLPRNVAKPVIDMLFPRGAPTRVPVIAITGTNGKSTTVRMVTHILRRAGNNVGSTTTSGIYLNEERIVVADASGPWSARVVLRDPTIDVAVLETARGGILREGLAFEECDIGAVLNIEADHIGLKGIDTIEDLADAKSVVVETVQRNGFSVLNADDRYTGRMDRRAGGQVIFFSLHGGSEMPDHLKEHIAAGGRAVIREPGPDGGKILIYEEDGERIPVMRVANIPATLDGLAEFNVQNALAAVAICHAHGLSAKAIRQGLCSFTSSFDQSPGRLNVFDGHGFRVIFDYAHNPAGLRALGKLLTQLRPRFRRLIGMINIPGDRRDHDIREMGEIAAGLFDEIVFREDPARRGRKPGEIVALLAEGALGAGFRPESIHNILDEVEAAEVCLKAARPGDLVVLTPTSVDEMWQQVLAFGSPESARQVPAQTGESCGAAA